MMKVIKKVMYYFSEEASSNRRLKAMNDFLGQAKDRVHLEQLENQWFKMNGYR